MPELPDITVYLEAIEQRILGEQLQAVRVNSPFLVRSFDPPIEAAHAKHVRNLRRIGKRIAIGLDDDLWIVLHLMIAGRLHWKPPGARLSGKNQLAALDFSGGALVLTEAGAKRRAALYMVRGEAALAEFQRGGIDVLVASPREFREALSRRNHTLKRALTDPTLLDGIGNAYSDEILHRANVAVGADAQAHAG